jgi:hypothetical protein
MNYIYGKANKKRQKTFFDIIKTQKREAKNSIYLIDNQGFIYQDGF